jgi:tetratricopeptide (TPR) repeat protein
VACPYLMVPLRSVPLSLACATLLISAIAAGQTTESPTLFKQAVALQQRGDLEGAVSAYQAFLASYPQNVEARSNLGVVLARLGRFEEAIDAYRKALAVDPGNVAVRVNLGIALYKAARFVDAAGELATVVASRPDNRQARLLLADCHLRMGEPKRVIELLQPLETSHATELALAYMLGLAYLQDKQVEKGQLLLDRILRNGDSAEARLMMGIAKRAAQDLSGSLADLGKAVELNPELPGAHSLYARALLETGNRDMARAEFLEELKRNPIDYDANLYLGVMLKDEAELDAALAHFTRALGLRPGDVATRFQIATVKVALGKSDEALPQLEAIVREAPEFVEAHVKLATVYYRLKRREDGDRERAIVDELNRQIQAKQPGAVAPNTKPPG